MSEFFPKGLFKSNGQPSPLFQSFMTTFYVTFFKSVQIGQMTWYNKLVLIIVVPKAPNGRVHIKSYAKMIF
jgi:hypothetical protein